MKEKKAEPDRPAAKEGSPLQRLLLESTADELALRLKEPFRPAKVNLVEIVARSVSVLSTMAAELGVVLRIQIRGEKILSMADEEKIRRVINALAIHLLTVSQSEGWITIGLEDQPLKGRRGAQLRLTAGSVVLPWKSDEEFEAGLNSQAELALCREIIEQHGGDYSIQRQDDNKVTYSVWLPS
jgi:signal transduction histidine kinase